MSLGDISDVLEGQEYWDVYDCRYFEQLAEEGFIIMYANPYHEIEIHGAIEGSVALARFGIMANGDILEGAQAADCFIDVRDGPSCGANIVISSDITSKQFTIFSNGNPFCVGIVINSSDLVRRGGVVFDRKVDGRGDVFLRGIMVMRDVEFSRAVNYASGKKLPILMGSIHKSAE